MTKIKLIILLLTMLFLFSCSKEIIITEDEITEDLFYLKHKLEPYTGACKVVYSDTNLIKEMLYFRNGRLDGEASSFYASGQLKWRGNYRKGFLSGKWIFWDENGNKTYELHYKSDTMHGDYKCWYSNGQAKEKGQYANNSKTGEWVCYNDKGEIVRNVSY